MEPVGRRGARVTAQVTVAVVAVAIAVVLGFVVGATLDSAPVVVPTVPPAATPPTPVLVLSRSLTLPAANLSPSFQSGGVGYWQRSYGGGTFHFSWSAPIVVDACMHNWVTADPFSIPLSNMTDCTSASGSVSWANATAGQSNFTIPSQESWFTVYVLSPLGEAVTVHGSYTITNGTTVLETLPYDTYVNAGQLNPPYVYENLTVPLPAGYDAITVQGNASQMISISFNLQAIQGWYPYLSSWNATAYYPSPPQLNVTMQALAPVPTNVTLGAIVFQA